MVVNPAKEFVDGEWKDIFIEILYENGTLRMSGAVGDSYGQLVIRYSTNSPHLKFNPGWNEEKWKKLLEIWNEWHLNDLRPGCRHQKDWGKEQIDVYTYELDRTTILERQKIQENAMQRLLNGETVTLDAYEIYLLHLPYSYKSGDNEPRSGYRLVRYENVLSGHVYPHEHPKGVLTKACPTCGHKYGTDWQKEEVPADVIAWLELC